MSEEKRIGPRSVGFALSALTLAIDQGNKLWLMDVYRIGERQPLSLAPFLDVVMAKNPGISYSLLSARTAAGRWGLFAFALAAAAALSLWLWRTRTILVAASLGLILGGALGNAVDRFSYGWVADFYYFHLGSFRWYVFNLADVAITFGVVLLLVDALFLSPGRAALPAGGAGR